MPQQNLELPDEAMHDKLKHRWAVRAALYFLAFFGIGLARWFQNSFDNPSIEQIAYHLRYSEGLVADTGGAFVVTFLVECVAVPMVFAALAVMVEGAVLHHWPQAARTSRAGTLLGWGARTIPGLALVFSTYTMATQLSAPIYLRSLFGKDYFGEHYVAPSTVQLRRGDLKNLVLIYVEGLETTYGDSELFGKDLLQGLRALGGTTFNQYTPAPGTAWTMGGLVGTQCGIPLKVMSLFDWSKASEGLTTFLPNAVCLGDVLKGFGYRNVFLGGARLRFAGKEQFLASHGYQERYGRSDWFRLGAGIGDMNDWGLYDDELFARAKVKLRELHQRGGRFNLTLLTLDTHHAFGFYSRRCKNEGVTDFEGIVDCTARQVAEFVQSAEQEGLLDNTRVVILGDHLAKPNPAYAKLQRAPQRTIFNAFIPASAAMKATDKILPFDVYPTILEFVGIDVVGGRLGLGYSALAEEEPTQRSSQEANALMSEVNNPSETYTNLWRRP